MSEKITTRGAIRAVDLFCGAGGSGCGARSAGVQIAAGFDIWDLAGQVYHIASRDGRNGYGDASRVTRRMDMA